MANIVVNERHLDDIARAIRVSYSSDTKYKPREMADAIRGIPRSDEIIWTLGDLLEGRVSGKIYLSCETIQTGIFNANTNLTGIKSTAKTIEAGAFSDCENLYSVNFPKCSWIGAAFGNCKALKEVNLPNITNLYAGTFAWCSGLESISLPKLTSIDSSGSGSYPCFAGCTSLKTVDLPSVRSLGDYSFSECEALTDIYLPNINRIGDFVFADCYNLKKLDLYNVETIDMSAFPTDGEKYCKLTTVILRRKDKIVNFQDNSDYGFNSAWYYNRTQVYVYVPQSLIDEYRNNRDFIEFRAIEDYPEICGEEVA